MTPAELITTPTTGRTISVQTAMKDNMKTLLRYIKYRLSIIDYHEANRKAPELLELLQHQIRLAEALGQVFDKEAAD
jgi:hypothetical protein